MELVNSLRDCISIKQMSKLLMLHLQHLLYLKPNSSPYDKVMVYLTRKTEEVIVHEKGSFITVCKQCILKLQMSSSPQMV